MIGKDEKIHSVQGLDQVARIASAFKLLADPTRLTIICLLFENRDGLCVNEISDYVGISQSAASHQLAKLEMQEIVHSFRDGQMICYAILDNTLTKNLERVIDILKK